MAVLFCVVWSMRAFDIIYLLTRGGPGEATVVLSYFVFTKAFEFGDLGAAAAVACVLAALTFGITCVYLRAPWPGGLGRMRRRLGESALSRQGRGPGDARGPQPPLPPGAADLDAHLQHLLRPGIAQSPTSLDPPHADPRELPDAVPASWGRSGDQDQNPQIGSFPRSFANSLIIASGTMALCLMLGSISAYSLSRFLGRASGGGCCLASSPPG